MQHVEVTRRFAAPIEAVWSVYTDHAGWSDWAGLGPARLVVEGTPDRNGIGAVRALGPGRFAAREEVLEFDAPKRMTYRVVAGPMPIRDHLGEVLLEPDGDGTLITWRCRFTARIPGTGALLRLVIERVFRGALEGLAKHRFPDR